MTRFGIFEGFQKKLSTCGKLTLLHKLRFWKKFKLKRHKFCKISKSFPKKDDSFYLDFAQLFKKSKSFKMLINKGLYDFSTVWTDTTNINTIIYIYIYYLYMSFGLKNTCVVLIEVYQYSKGTLRTLCAQSKKNKTLLQGFWRIGVWGKENFFLKKVSFPQDKTKNKLRENPRRGFSLFPWRCQGNSPFPAFLEG